MTKNKNICGQSIVTEKQFQQWFVSEVKYWVKKFGLMEWELRFELKDSDEYEACISADIESTDVIFTLFKLWQSEYFSEKSIRKAAFHEVKELMLYPLRVQAESREFNIDNFNKEIHRVIRRFENTIFEDRFNKLISKRK